MILMAGYSIKAWWLAVGTPVVGFLAGSVSGALVAIAIVLIVAEGRRRWLQGARGLDLLSFHHTEGGDPHGR